MFCKSFTLGIHKKSEARFKQVGKPISIETQGYETAISGFLKQHLTKAAHALDVVPAPEREISSMTIPVAPDNIEKARND